MSEILDAIMNEALDDAIDKVVVENEADTDKFVRVYSFVSYTIGKHPTEKDEKEMELFRKNCDRIFERFMTLLPCDTDWRRERFDIPGYKIVDGYLIRKQRTIEDVTKLLAMIALAYNYRKDSYGRQIGVSIGDKNLHPRIAYNALFPQDGTEYVEIEHRERYKPIEMIKMFYYAYSSLCLEPLTEYVVRNELLTHEYIACISYCYLRTVESAPILTFPLECTGKMFGIFPNELGKKYTSVDDLQSVFGSYYAIPVVFDKAVLSVSTKREIVFIGRFYFKDAYHYVAIADYTIRQDEQNKGYDNITQYDLKYYLHLFQKILEEIGVVLTDEIISDVYHSLDPHINLSSEDIAKLFAV